MVLGDLVSRLSHLRSKKMVMYRNQNSFPDLQSLSLHQHLMKKELRGKIREDVRGLHHNLGFLRRSLVELILRYSQLEQDPMAILEESPRSKSRTLVNPYKGSQLNCSAHGL